MSTILISVTTPSMRFMENMQFGYGIFSVLFTPGSFASKYTYPACTDQFPVKTIIYLKFSVSWKRDSATDEVKSG